MKKIALTSLLLASAPVSLMADEPPVLSQPGPADSMVFEHAYPQLDKKEKTYPPLDVKINGIENGRPIPEKFAYCAPDGKGATKDGGNISPAIHWLNPPEATRSFALIVVDPDVPASFDNANKPGQEIAARSPRQSFYHWVLTDIPAASHGIFEGADSKGITPGGKQVGVHNAYGISGQNDYVKVWPGPHGGYDGPCPPWNDLRLHHYHFVLYALDVPSLYLPNPITGPQAEAAMQGHILAKGEVVGVFSTNSRWQDQFKKDAGKQTDLVPGERFTPE